MSLREMAETDLANILEDEVTGFGWPITVTDPSGLTESLTGYSRDIAMVLDPDTGQAVTGRSASVSLRISSLYALGFGMPLGIADAAEKPWVVEFNDINGLPYKFKIFEANPDRALGVVTCFLETYE